MKITRKAINYFVLFICCFALIFAWVAEYIFGILPCVLCYYQRYLYIAVILLLSTHFFIFGGRLPRFFSLLASFCLFACAGLAAYQVAIEYHWVEVPQLCKTSVSTDNFEQFKAMVRSTTAVSCDKVQFSLFGISMAGYNVLLSIGLGLLSLIGVFINDKKKKFTTRRS